MPSSGLFIVIEGSDGSGKTTQFNLLRERLQATGYDVEVFVFPRYNHESSYFVRKYLDGAYGPAAKVSPYTASLFYALDRYETAKDIRRALDAGKIVLASRFVGSNMAHQGGKFKDPVEQRGFFVWEDNLEFQMLNIPRPDLSLFLRVPAEVSYDLIRKRSAVDGTADKKVEHEDDLGHLKNAVATYDLLCKLFPKDFRAIECTEDGNLMSVAEISNLIWEQLKPLLPSEKPNPSHSVVVTLGGSRQETPHTVQGGLTDELSQNIKSGSLLLRLEIQRSAPANITEFISWAASDYSFYTPQGLPKNIEQVYKTSMGVLASTHLELYQKLIRYLEKQLLSGDEKPSMISVSRLLLPLTPLSAVSNFHFRLRKNTVVPLTSRLLASDIEEVQWAAKQIYTAARQRWPRAFKQPVESSGGPELINSIIAKLAEERLPKDHSADNDIKLLEAHPRLEFDLLGESIYPYTVLSLEEITEEVSSWPYLQKYESLKQAANQPELLKKVRYKMDVVSDQLALNEILTSGSLQDVQTQTPTPRYGFNVPEVIEDAGLDDLYNKNFDESLKLYSLMQGAGREDLAPYATLLGHRLRWQLDTDAMSLKAIIKQAPADHKRLITNIAEKVAEVHPLLWEAILSEVPAAVNQRRNGKSRIKPSSQISANKSPRKKRR